MSSTDRVFPEPGAGNRRPVGALELRREGLQRLDAADLSTIQGGLPEKHSLFVCAYSLVGNCTSIEITITTIF